MDKKTILNLSKKYSSFYLYDESQILSNISQLYHAFPNIKLLYSIKSNSNQEVLKTIFNNNLGADAASINEAEIIFFTRHLANRQKKALKIQH